MLEETSALLGQVHTIYEKREQELQQAQADLQQSKAALKQEKALMQTVPVADNDIVNLNVGGTLLSTKRSTLTQAAGSTLAAMFSGRWEQCLDYDHKGRVFLDFDPYSFQQIMSYLRSCNICSRATDSIPLPEIEPGKRKIFRDLVKYLSLEEYMGMGCLSLAKFVRAHPAVQILEEGQRAKLLAGQSKYNSVVAELCNQQVGFLKVKIHQAKSHSVEWIFLGIGQNINLSANDNYSASSSYGWSSNGVQWVGGAHTPSQVKWRNGDWVLLKLDLQANRLSMLASGLASPYQVTIQPAGQYKYDFHVILYNVGDEVEILPVTAEDQQLLP